MNHSMESVMPNSGRARKTRPPKASHPSRNPNDLSHYMGEWVATCSGKVVSHNSSFKKAYLEAKKRCPGKRPLFTKVPDQDTIIL